MLPGGLEKKSLAIRASLLISKNDSAESDESAYKLFVGIWVVMIFTDFYIFKNS